MNTGWLGNQYVHQDYLIDVKKIINQSLQQKMLSYWLANIHILYKLIIFIFNNDLDKCSKLKQPKNFNFQGRRKVNFFLYLRGRFSN